MTQEKLREGLEELHVGLLQSAPLTEEGHKERDELAAHIRAALDSDDLSEHYFTLRDLLGESLAAFEQQHPKLVKLTLGIVDTLSSIGV